MNTSQIMNMALEMIDIKDIPADSAIYNSGSGIKKVLMGIDMGVAELALAKELGYDAVIAHHPQGAVRTFYKIIDEHIEQMVAAGVPRKEAIQAVKSLKEEYEFKAHITNADHVTSFARLIGMPFLNIHYPLDQLGRQRMVKAIEDNVEKDGTVGDIVKALKTIPEFEEAKTDIKIRLGNKDKPAGKIVFSHGAGTNGRFDVANAYYENGIDTLIYIHIHYAVFVKLKEKYKQNKNLIVTGHTVSDLIGINPFIKKLEDNGVIVNRVSGL